MSTTAAKPHVSAARRVLEFLQKASAIPSNTPSVEGWAITLGVSKDDRAAIMNGVALVFSQIALAKAECQTKKVSKPDLYLNTLAEIEGLLLNGFLQGFTNQWGNVTGPLVGAQMRSLEFCAERMDDLAEEVELPADALDKLRKQIEVVIASTLKADLDDATKRDLVSRLHDLHRVILEYRIGGVEPIRRAAEATLGALVVANYSHPKTKSRLEYLRTVGGVIHLALQLVHDAAPYLPMIAAKAKGIAGLLASGQ